MFEAVELGRKVSKAAFAAREEGLRSELIDAQRRAREANVPLVIVVAGLEGAGKGEVIHQLTDWLDTRGVQVHAFWDDTEEERQRPEFWRYWRVLPPKGEIAILFGSWYTPAIRAHAAGECDDGELELRLTRMREFERMLSADGTLVLKFWFHLTHAAQRERLAADEKLLNRHGKPLKVGKKRYARVLSSAEHAIRSTDTGFAPWYLIEAHDARYRDLTVGETLLEQMNKRLDVGVNTSRERNGHDAVLPADPDAQVSVLDRLDLTQSLGDKEYERRLDEQQRRLNDLSWRMHQQGVSVVLVFEGWDAAGKGGALRRLTHAIDPRLFRTIRVSAPSDEERAHHYLWRFWRQLPRDGYFTLYDRSWYGRVLVERVEGYANEAEWRRAYAEINEFEQQLQQHGTVVLKFWLHISAEQQLERFREREQTAYKQHKIGEDDWRNRSRWDDYERAVNEMIVRTSTQRSPWRLIAANDKKFARVQVIDAVCDALNARLEQ